MDDHIIHQNLGRKSSQPSSNGVVGQNVDPTLEVRNEIRPCQIFVEIPEALESWKRMRAKEEHEQVGGEYEERRPVYLVIWVLMCFVNVDEDDVRELAHPVGSIRRGEAREDLLASEEECIAEEELGGVRAALGEVAKVSDTMTEYTLAMDLKIRREEDVAADHPFVLPFAWEWGAEVGETVFEIFYVEV